MILLGFHLDQMKTQEELTKLEIILKELNEKYEDSDLIAFADLNVDINSTKFEKLKKNLKLHNLHILTLQNLLERDKDTYKRIPVQISIL